MTTKNQHCYWWNRWYHRRLRRIDATIMRPALEDALDNSIYISSPTTLERVWDVFKDQSGQEHWTCECAPNDD